MNFIFFLETPANLHGSGTVVALPELKNNTKTNKRKPRSTYFFT
jgi:hypothetical protein